MSLSGLMDELSQARTKKKEFLEQMDQLIPWEKWVGEIKSCYYKGERGNKPYGIELMLRLYVLQNLYRQRRIIATKGQCRQPREGSDRKAGEGGCLRVPQIKLPGRACQPESGLPAQTAY